MHYACMLWQVLAVQQGERRGPVALGKKMKETSVLRYIQRWIITNGIE